ncbi:hypothetical protein BH11PSE11_BH11PSE11_23750 [soil metagenome]
MSTITVRPALSEDALALAMLLSEMDEAEIGKQGAPRDHSRDASLTREILGSMGNYPDFRAYLALDAAGVPVGTFSLFLFKSLAHRGAQQALLDAVVVTRSLRGSGIGRAMLERAVQIASAAGCYKLSLSSNLKRVDAHRFYARLGFVQHGISLSLPLGGEDAHQTAAGCLD